MFKKILIAYDGSAQSKHALDHAAEMADSCKGQLVILTVVPREGLPVFPTDGMSPEPVLTNQDWEEYQEKMKANYQKSQEDALKDVKEHYPKLKVDAIILDGRPSSTIVEQAEKNQADLIVMGSRGLGGITGWILGSTSRRVVESCTKPILIIK